LIRWIGYYSLTKVFKGKPFISKPISSLLTWGKLALFVFNTIVYNSALYSASELQNMLSMKSALEQNHTIDVLLTRYSASCSGSTRNLALPESDSQNLDSSRTVKPYWKFQTKKPIKSRF
jgi:hypothetical protein